MKRIDASCKEDLLDLREACTGEIDKLKKALENPFMRREIRNKCRKRIAFLEKSLGMFKERIFLTGLREEGLLQDMSRGAGTCES